MYPSVAQRQFLLDRIAEDYRYSMETEEEEASEEKEEEEEEEEEEEC